MKRWEDATDREITVYALVMALLPSGGAFARPVLDLLRGGFSWSWWLPVYVLTAVVLGTLAFFVNRQVGRYMRHYRRRYPPPQQQRPVR